MDLAGVGNYKSVVYKKRDAFLRRMSIRMPFFLSVSFVVRKVCLSVRLRVSVCAVMASILVRAV